MGIQICSHKEAGPLWGPIRGKIRKKENFNKSSKIIFLWTTYWPECFDVWHGASLGQGELGLFK